jgi:hypothetical protein
MEVSGALEQSIAGLSQRLADAPDAAGRRAELTAVYDLFLSAGRSIVDLPPDLLPEMREALAGDDARTWNALNNRPRTAFRLVAAGHYEAARAVLAEAAWTAKVDPAFVHVDGGQVFAWLPGFRDVRFDAPDSCYDISDGVGLSATVDAAHLTRERLLLGGTAYLTRAVTATPVERVFLVLSRSGMADVMVPGRRHRRPELVSGSGIDLSRRAWSGFSVDIDLASMPPGSGTWRLALALDHDGLRRRVDLGKSADALAKQEGNTSVRRRRTVWRLDTSGQRWALVAHWDRWFRSQPTHR